MQHKPFGVPRAASGAAAPAVAQAWNSHSWFVLETHARARRTFSIDGERLVGA